ncbi:MAG: class I SAM-dependent RNA methyltransferase, partial [Chlamydiia bacterium]|nr:class I SAM-dependent RNA methyltransferase [Chlamydiia bacterium]
LSLFLRVQQVQKGSPTQYYEMHLDGSEHYTEELLIEPSTLPKRSFRFKVSPSAFFQPNPRQAERLYARALEMAELNANQTLWDLCCGIGSIGICAAPHVAAVVGVEVMPEAILDARQNAEMNGVENIRFFCEEVGNVALLAQREGLALPDVVIVDPPRAGLGEVGIEAICRLAPQRLIYISCQPKTQADDLVALTQRGYRCVALQPVDQFPQTPHLENIALLIR